MGLLQNQIQYFKPFVAQIAAGVDVSLVLELTQFSTHGVRNTMCVVSACEEALLRVSDSSSLLILHHLTS